MLQQFTCLTIKQVEKPAPEWGPDEKRLEIVEETDFVRCFDPATIAIIQEWFEDEYADTPRPGTCRVFDYDDNSFVVKLSVSAMLAIVNAAKRDGNRLEILSRQQ